MSIFLPSILFKHIIFSIEMATKMNVIVKILALCVCIVTLVDQGQTSLGKEYFYRIKNKIRMKNMLI